MANLDVRGPVTARDEKYAYFGTIVEPRTFVQWLDNISLIIETGRRGWLSAHHNLHSLFMLHSNPALRHFYERCNDCYIDGTPVRFILRGFGVTTAADQRFSLMDHFLELLLHAERKHWAVFYLGSQTDAVDMGRELIQKEFPALRMQLQPGYDRNEAALIQSINAFRPDILLVGMGVPMQELWLLKHLDELDVAFVTHAGGTLDYYTGAQAKPPRWLSRAGFAWIYRLAHDPFRLWRRYLFEPCVLLYPTLRQWFRYGRSQ